MGGLASLLILAVAASAAAPVSGTEEGAIRAHFAAFADACGDQWDASHRELQRLEFERLQRPRS